MVRKIISNLPWNEKIKVLRTAKGWTQAEAAEICSTNQKMYWNWEKGKNYPRIHSQRIISRAYNVHISEIFSQRSKEL